MSMETIVVFKDSYDRLVQDEFKYMTELYKLRGTIIGLSKSADSMPEFVADQLKELAKKFEINSN